MFPVARWASCRTPVEEKGVKKQSNVACGSQRLRVCTFFFFSQAVSKKSSSSNLANAAKLKEERRGEKKKGHGWTSYIHTARLACKTSVAYMQDQRKKERQANDHVQGCQRKRVPTLRLLNPSVKQRRVSLLRCCLAISVWIAPVLYNKKEHKNKVL